MKKTIKAIGFIAAIVIVSLAAWSLTGSKRIMSENDSLHPLLDEEFSLAKNQTAVLENTGFSVKLVEFYNSSCPAGFYCFWSGIGVLFEYKYEDQIETRIFDHLGETYVFGHKIQLIDTDYKKYARLKISKEATNN